MASGLSRARPQRGERTRHPERAEQTARVGPRERWAGSAAADALSRTGLGLGFLVIGAGLAVTTPSITTTQLVAFVLLVALYAVAYRTVFRHVASSSVPTEPALVALLFLIPVSLVPLAVMLAQFLAEPLRPGGTPWTRTLLIRLCSGWHCLGPVVVFLIAEPGPPDLADWPVYLAALAAQFVADIGTALIREYALGRDVRVLAMPMLWSVLVDATLAAIALPAIVATGGTMTAIPLVAVPIAFLALLIRDRRQLAQTRAELGREVMSAREEARVDALTGLGNRRAWREAVDAAEQALRVHSSWSAGVVLADLDNLKQANDTHGHDVGDELIRAAAAVAQSVTPPGAAVCRTGGDEFAILLVGPRDQLDLTGLMVRWHEAERNAPRVVGLWPSVALGASDSRAGEPITAAIRRADDDVFADKRRRQVARPTLLQPGGSVRSNLDS